MSRYTITADGRPYTIDTEHGSLIVAGSHFAASLETLRALGELAQRVMDDDVEPDRAVRKADLMDRAMADVDRQRRIALHRAATQALPVVEGHPPVQEDSTLPQFWKSPEWQFWTAPEWISTPDELAEWRAEMIERTAAGLPNRSHGRRSLGKI